MVVKYPALGDG